MTWTIPVEEDEHGELFITLPDELLEESGLKPGDDVEWIDNSDGSFTLKKLN
jgi:bifunctional DNA-binding transcriptional regulator/antitoxin component of YhaV-PrlF toxin-antitoxin module